MTTSPDDDGAAVAAETVPDIDIWSWSGDSDPSLDRLLEIKTAVLSHPPLRKQLQGQLDDLDTATEDQARVAGLTWWLLARYHRAWPLLEQCGSTSGAVLFAKAECCLRGEVTEGGARLMRRPALAAEILQEHPEFKKNHKIFGTYIEALVHENDADALKAALKNGPKAFRESPTGRYYGGLLQEWSGETVEATETYEKVLEEDPDNRLALFRLAFRADLDGDDELALELYGKLCAQMPPDLHSLLNYGVLLEDYDRNKEAARCYEQVLDHFPNHRRAQSYLRDAQGSLAMVFDEDTERRHDKRNRLLRIPINDFELSVRARNCLAKMKIESLGDLVHKTEAELLAYKNFGETSLNEIKGLLESKGLRLGMNLDEDPIPLHPTQPAPRKAATAIDLPPGVDPAVLKIVLADLDLSVRCRKAISQVSAVTVGDLMSRSESELLGLKNFGQTSLVELRSRLLELGVDLRKN